MKKIFFVFAVSIILMSLCFTACHTGDANGMGTFSVRVGGGASRVMWNGYETDTFTYNITLSNGPGADQSATIEPDAEIGTAHFTVKPGNWTITVKGIYDGDVVAEGSATKYIIAGKNGSVSITMDYALGIIDVIMDYNDAFQDVTQHFEYEVTLTGASTKNYKIGKDVEKVIHVAPGTWKVKLDAYAAGMLIASGESYNVDVEAGKSTQAKIDMYDPEDGGVDVHIVGADGWADAVGKIGNSDYPKHLMILTADFNATGIDPDDITDENTAEIAIKIAIIGNNHTISLSSAGVLLYIDENRKVTIQDVNLEGKNDNVSPLVETNGTLIMNGGSISGNTNSGNGGGVLISGGTFIMNDGIISGNTASAGGGVYVGGNGTFTMNGGTITANIAPSQANSAGGIHVSKGSTFNSKGGTFSGNSPSDIYREP